MGAWGGTGRKGAVEESQAERGPRSKSPPLLSWGLRGPSPGDHLQVADHEGTPSISSGQRVSSHPSRGHPGWGQPWQVPIMQVCCGDGRRKAGKRTEESTGPPTETVQHLASPSDSQGLLLPGCFSSPSSPPESWWPHGCG